MRQLKNSRPAKNGYLQAVYAVLTRLYIGKTSKPTVMMSVASSSNLGNRGTIKPVLLAESMNPVYNVFDSIRRCEDKGFTSRSIFFSGTDPSRTASTHLSTGLITRRILLACILIWIKVTSLPSFVMCSITSSDLYKRTSTQAMLFTKISQMVHEVLYTIGRGKNKFFSIIRCMTQGGLTHLIFCLWTAFFAYPCYSGVMFVFFCLFIASHNTPMVFDLFRGWFPSYTSTRSTKLGSSALFTRGLRNNSAKARACNLQNVKTIFIKWLHLIQPMLFTWNQHYWKHDILQYIKGKSIRSILIPSPLQFNIVVFVALKTSKVFFTTLAEIYGASYVYLACGNTRDAIYTGDIRDRFMVQWLHGYHPSYQGGDLGFMGATNTCKAEQYAPPLYHSNRSPSSFTRISHV